MQIKRLSIAVLVIIFTLFAGYGFIALAEHGPAGSHLVDVGPVSPDYGFPMWYEDANGLILEPCLNPDLCFFFPPDPAAPISFPDNFADEIFYWAAESLMIDATPPEAGDPTGKLGRAILTLALEGAFFNNGIVMGEQVVFGRIRIRVDNLAAGEIYTVTHPFGQDVFEAGVDAGPGVIKGPGISYVEDIGIGALGDFTGAFNSRIGPFLTWNPATAPVPPAGYIADGLTPAQVVGSPFGTNFFRIEGVNVGDPGSVHLCADPTLGPDPIATTDCIESDLFSVQGKLATRFGVGINGLTYSRNGLGAGSVNVFAGSVSGQTQTIEITVPTLANTTAAGDANGNYFAAVNYAGTPPTVVTATNTTDNPVTAVSAPPIDLIRITRAEFNLDTGELTIEATSSDLFAPPTLTAAGYGSLTTGSLVVPGLLIPPAFVTVSSSAGGSDTEPVRVVSTSQGLPPVAVDDTAVTLEETAVTLNVTANDTDADGTVQPATTAIVIQPANGTVVNHGDGTVTYTPDLNFAGTDTFTYTVQDDIGATSNQATVTITVTNVNDAPVAADDTPLTLTNMNVLANDVDIDGTLDPATVTIVNQPANGAAAVNLDGTITYTPNTGFVGSDTFTYTVDDNDGAMSNEATVTVTVTSGEPILVITAPADGDSFVQGTAVTFTGTASDNEDGDISAAITWTSDLDGALGSGGSLTVAALSAGSHTITAGVTDSNGFTATAGITITVLGGPSPVAPHGPVHPVHGLPVWYQDSLGTMLEICLDSQDPNCGYLAGDIPDINAPIVFPDNFPAEPLYWMAESVILNGGQKALLSYGLTGGFVNGTTVVDGEQITTIFMEIRIDTLQPFATYTITHPYGVDVLTADDQGAIRTVVNIGGDNAGDFIGVFNGLPGPLLSWDPISAAPAGYLGNPLIEHVITGSPFGTNFFRIEGPDAGGPGINMLESDKFAVQGKLLTAAAGPNNTAPAVTIDTPLNGSLFNQGDTVSLTGTVTDAEEPGLGTFLTWSSDIDGQLGMGTALNLATLSSGVHTITAFVADAGGLTASDAITITINGAPTLTVTSPTSGSNFTEGTAVTFTATATDLEDGDISANISWTSDLDGAIGSGGSFVLSTLSVGTHMITAAVTDSNGFVVQTAVTVTIDANPTNQAPTIAITGPADGGSFVEATVVTLTGVASDAEDGSLNTSIIWTSDKDGPIGTGTPYFVSSLSLGAHTITASVTDSGGLTSTATITITITPAPVDTLTVDKADYRSRSLVWRIEGTTTEPGSVITIYIGTSVGGQILATGIVADSLGDWAFFDQVTDVFPDVTATISVSSSSGGVLEAVPLRIR
ncbi:MAG: tandem-95 repeat protein [Anaerolineae bacterium]